MPREGFQGILLKTFRKKYVASKLGFGPGKHLRMWMIPVKSKQGSFINLQLLFPMHYPPLSDSVSQSFHLEILFIVLTYTLNSWNGRITWTGSCVHSTLNSSGFGDLSMYPVLLLLPFSIGIQKSAASVDGGYGWRLMELLHHGSNPLLKLSVLVAIATSTDSEFHSLVGSVFQTSCCISPKTTSGQILCMFSQKWNPEN